MKSSHTWQHKGKHEGKEEAGGVGEGSAPALGRFSTCWVLQFARAPTQSLSAQKQEQEFACLNKSPSRGQILSRSQLTRLAGAQWAYVSPVNEGQDLVYGIRSWDGSCGVKTQEQQMHSKTLGLSFTSEHEEPQPGWTWSRADSGDTEANSLQH